MDKDRIAGAAKDVAGKVEGAVGDMAGNAQTQAEGRAREAAGTVQNLYGQAKDAARDAGDAAVGEGTAHDQQAGLAGLEPQQSPYAPLRHQRAHDVLGALQRRHADQELVGRDAGEVVAQVAGGDLRVDVALLDLQRRSVREVGQKRVIELRAGLDPAALGELT